MNSYDEQLSCSIYLRYVQVLRIMAGYMNVPVDDREDLIQETFARYFASYSKQSQEWSEFQIKGMVVTIFRNCYNDYVRRMSRRPVTYLEPERFERGDLSSENLVGKDPQNVILEEQEHQDIIDALDKMKPEWSEIIKKLVIEERTVADVSEELGISKEACRTRLCRAREMLRKMMDRREPEKMKPEQKPLKRTAQCEDKKIAREPEASGLPGQYIEI